MKKILNRIEKTILPGSLLFLIAGTYLENRNVQVTYSKEMFGNPVLSFCSAGLLTVSMFGIFYSIEKNSTGKMVKKVFSILGYFGKNSIVILCTHLILLYGIRVLEQMLNMQIHTFPVMVAFVIIVAIEFGFIKMMPNWCWKLFGR